MSLWALRAPTPPILLGPPLQLHDPKAALKAYLFCFCLNQMHPYKKNLKKTLDQDPKHGPKKLFFQAYRSNDSGMSPTLTFMRVTIWLTDHQLCGECFYCRGNTSWCPVGDGPDSHIWELVPPPVRRGHQNGEPSRAERKDFVGIYSMPLRSEMLSPSFVISLILPHTVLPSSHLLEAGLGIA